jgi:flagellar biosynthesis/type III secretory pathway chaperone
MRMSELDDAVKAFLAPAQQGETIVVEDEEGRLQCGVTPFVQLSAAEKKAALATLDRLRQKSAETTTNLGATEADIDRELQDGPALFKVFKWSAK